MFTSGQFMLDSESQHREAIQKILEPQKGGQGTPTAPTELAGPGAGSTNYEAMGSEMASGQTNVIKYICPMPEHVSIEYDRPGKCPICGMTVVPVSSSTMRRLQPGGKLLYYTCPMPEHSDVRSDKPGKCPKCGMTLIPVMEAPSLPKAAPAANNATPEVMVMPKPQR